MQQDITIPANVEAEKGLIGSILLDSTILNKVEGRLLERDFYEQRNRIIFASLISLYREGKNVDITSLISDLETKDTLTKAGGFEYISSLADIGYSTRNAETYIKFIEDASLRRDALKLLQTLTEKGYQGNTTTENFIDDMETSVFALSKRKKTGTFTNIKNITGVVLANAEARSKQKENIVGLKTGFPSLDNYTLGFQGGQLILLGARPAMGKSAFAVNLVVNVASKNKKGRATVAMFSLEMPQEQLVERMIASDSKISLKNIKRGYLKEAEWVRIQTACTRLNNLNIYFSDETDLTVNKIKSVCRQLKEQDDLDFVVIDYLQLIKSEGGNSLNEEVGKISRALKLMALELNVPILALSQLSRAIEKRDDKRPIMADLRDSGSIEQDADIIMFLYRDDYYNKQNSTRKGEADLIIAKNRSGQTTEGDGIAMMFNGDFSNFIEKTE